MRNAVPITLEALEPVHGHPRPGVRAGRRLVVDAARAFLELVVERRLAWIVLGSGPRPGRRRPPKRPRNAHPRRAAGRRPAAGPAPARAPGAQDEPPAGRRAAPRGRPPPAHPPARRARATPAPPPECPFGSARACLGPTTRAGRAAAPASRAPASADCRPRRRARGRAGARSGRSGRRSAAAWRSRRAQRTPGRDRPDGDAQARAPGPPRPRSAPGPRLSQSRSTNATGAEPSFSNPSQPFSARSPHAPGVLGRLAGVQTTNGLATANATAPRPMATASRRRSRYPATTSGTSNTMPGYFAAVASPASSPASSSRLVTRSPSETVASVVNGTSVTAVREYATWAVATAVKAAATKPARVPYARAPSHHAAAMPATPTATTTSRPARYEGSSRPSWKGASNSRTNDG